MERKTCKYSISAWRKNANEKSNINKTEYYKKNQEKLAEKACERMDKSENKGKSSSNSHLLNMKKLCLYFSSFASSVNII